MIYQKYLSNPDGTRVPIILLSGHNSLNPSSFKVGATSVRVLAANSDRMYALFQNDSDAVIYLMPGKAASLSEGIRLNPSATYEMSASIGNLDIRDIYAISPMADKNLLIMEG